MILLQNIIITFVNILDVIMNKISKIFVAGGTGLVGSAIIKNLLEKGYTNIISNYHNRPPITTNDSLLTFKKLE